MPTPRLELILGCMFSGKTTELLRRLREAQSRGDSVLAIKPHLDTRYAAPGTESLATHTGDRLPATAIHSPADLLAAAASAAVIGIDETHFFGAPLADACLQLRASGRRVILAGVHLDHFGKPFDPFPQLTPHADDVITLTAPCAICGQPAIHSQRMTANSGSARIIVGGPESYQSRCQNCFVPTPRRADPEPQRGDRE